MAQGWNFPTPALNALPQEVNLKTGAEKYLNEKLRSRILLSKAEGLLINIAYSSQCKEQYKKNSLKTRQILQAVVCRSRKVQKTGVVLVPGGAKPEGHEDDHEMVNMEYACDHCRGLIVGSRINCNVCEDFDLCFGCYNAKKYPDR